MTQITKEFGNEKVPGNPHTIIKGHLNPSSHKIERITAVIFCPYCSSRFYVSQRVEDYRSFNSVLCDDDAGGCGKSFIVRMPEHNEILVEGVSLKLEEIPFA